MWVTGIQETIQVTVTIFTYLSIQVALLGDCHHLHTVTIYEPAEYTYIY